MDPALPIQYHLEVYESSFVNDASLSLTSSTPTPSFAVGDLLDHRGLGNWRDKPGPNQTYRVAEVRHILWQIQGSHIGHTVMVRVEVVSFS